MSRIIIVKPAPRRPGYCERLEARALRAVRIAHVRGDTSPGLWSVIGELALTLDQLNSLRRTRASLLSELDRLERKTDFEIRRLFPPSSIYEDRYRSQRERLRSRQLKLQAERRRLTLGASESLRPFHERLLTLLGRKRYLGLLYED